MPHYLLYDEGCSLCVRFQKGIKKWDRRGLIEAVGFSDPRIPQIVPKMNRDQLLNSFHLVFPDGKVLSGNRALPDLLGLLPGLKPVGWLLRCLPGVPQMGDRLYAWIARRRR